MKHIRAREGAPDIRRRAAGGGGPDIRGVDISCLAGEIVGHGLQSFRLQVGLEGGLDRADGLQCRGVGPGEATERDGFGVGLGGDDLAVLDPRGDEAAGDAGVWLAVGFVFARDGEVEAVAVKGLAVDLEWIGGEHINVFG